MQKDGQEQGTVVRGRGRTYRMGQQGIRGLKTRVERECSISRQRARLYSGSIQVGGIRGESHSVTSGDTAGGQLHE